MIGASALGSAFELLEILIAIVIPAIITSTTEAMNILNTVRFGNIRKARSDFFVIFDSS